MKVVKPSNSKILHSLFPGRAGLAAALALLLLGTSAPLLVAQSVSDNFNADGAIPPGPDAPPNWTAYSLPDYPDFGYGPENSEATYSFPTNTAGPAGNYAFRIQAPAIAFDYAYGFTRAGAFRTDVTYGNAADEVHQGRFSVQADLIKWNNNWPDQLLGLAWYIRGIDNVNTLAGYVAGWGPDLATLGVVRVDLSAALGGGIDSAYSFVGNTVEGSTPLDPTHQWRLVASTYDGTNFLATLYDLAQPTAPWASAYGADSAYSLTPGYCGIFEANTDALPGLVASGDNSTDGADSTWDNYSSTWPDPNAYPGASLPATVTQLLPRPATSATGYFPQGEVDILNRDSNVQLGTIGVYMDGVRYPSSALTISNYLTGMVGADASNYSGAMVFWTITNTYAGGSWHTNKVVFQDDYNNTPASWHTNVWSWTSATPKRLATTGSLSIRGFDARLVQSAAANLGNPNSLALAKAVLNYQYAVDRAATNIVDVVAFDIANPPSHYGAVTNFPGLCLPTSYPNSFAVQALGYVQLTAGTNHFYVDSDDAVGVYTGQSLTDTSVPLFVGDGGPAHGAFDFVVLQDGLYPLNVIFEEGGGDAYLVLRSANSSGPLVNAAGGAQVFYPLVVKSATSADGTYTVDAAANAGNVLTKVGVSCDGSGAPLNQTVTGGTLTIPTLSGPTKYYRLDGPRNTRFTSVTPSGSGLVITYEAD